MDVKQLNIIGCGRAGGSLAQLWIQSGRLGIGGVKNRSAASSQRAVAMLGQGAAIEQLQDFPSAPFWMLGCSDDQLEPVAQELAELDLPAQGATVFHLAGRFGSAVLEPLGRKGCRLASVHPVRSLTGEALTLDTFADTACVAQGDAEALLMLEPLFQAIGARWMPVKALERGLYHAALSIISNVTKAVSWKSQKWLEDAGLNEEDSALIARGLLNSTLADLDRAAARHSITGPIVRGDTSTVEAHIASLARVHPEDGDIYRVLARAVLELARDRGDLSAETLAHFDELLSVN